MEQMKPFCWGAGKAPLSPVSSWPCCWECALLHRAVKPKDIIREKSHACKRQSFLFQSHSSIFVEMFFKNSVCLMLRRACSCLMSWRSCSEMLHPYESTSPVRLPREVRPMVSCWAGDGHTNYGILGTDPSLPQFSLRCENVAGKILNSIWFFQPDLPLLDTFMGQAPSSVKETKMTSLNNHSCSTCMYFNYPYSALLSLFSVNSVQLLTGKWLPLFCFFFTSVSIPCFGLFQLLGSWSHWAKPFPVPGQKKHPPAFR